LSEVQNCLYRGHKFSAELIGMLRIAAEAVCLVFEALLGEAVFVWNRSTTLAGRNSCRYR
jgi:hypothetical protein